MKTEYKGYELSASREDSLCGIENLYFSAYRLSDGLEVICDFTEGEDSEEDFIESMKVRIDGFIETRGESEDMLEDY